MGKYSFVSTIAEMVLKKRAYTFRFEQTCSASPEQYDIYLKDKECRTGERLVGYFRLRSGRLTVCAITGPEDVGTCVLSCCYGGGGESSFMTDRDRAYFQQVASDCLLYYMKEKKLL